MAELPDRPRPAVAVAERVRAWLQWVGPGRVAASGIGVLALVAGAYWLVKPPPATTESKLPFAAKPAVTTTLVAAPATTAAPSGDGMLLVHVAGAVVTPSVYRLAPTARVIDAVAAAGGLTADANADAINLASPLADGQRVYVPRAGEASPPRVDGPTMSGSGSPAGPVNLNTADADQLDELPGVGPTTAAAIIAHRDQHGPFASVDALADVRGIGPAKLDALRGLVTV